MNLNRLLLPLDFYEEDIVACRIEMDDDGVDNVDIAIWVVEIQGYSWTLGGKIED